VFHGIFQNLLGALAQLIPYIKSPPYALLLGIYYKAFVVQQILVLIYFSEAQTKRELQNRAHRSRSLP
jgi:hypothetical protein